MSVADNKVVEIHYILTNDQKMVLDKSAENQPLKYLHGKKNIIPGLEKELTGKNTGDALSVVVSPEEAYGKRNEELVHKIPAEYFKGVSDVKPGMQFQMQSNQGPLLVVVTKVEADGITVDQNHPLADMTLFFDVKIGNIRDASAKEIEMGQVIEEKDCCSPESSCCD